MKRIKFTEEEKKERARAAVRKWQNDNRERYREAQKKWRNENPEYFKKYYESLRKDPVKKEKLLTVKRNSSSNWRKNNLEAYRAYQREYHKKWYALNIKKKK